jgi:hypothetical protein
MKRSEMIALMIEASKDYNPLSPIDYHQAICILEHIEKAGMLPPSAPLEIAGQQFRDNFWEQE